VLCDALKLRKNLLVVANFHRDQETPWAETGHIDLWVPWDFLEPVLPQSQRSEGGHSSDSERQAEILAHLSLILQLGHLSSTQLSLRRHVRLLTAAPEGTSISSDLIASKLASLHHWLQWARIRQGEAEVVTGDESPSETEGRFCDVLWDSASAAAIEQAHVLNRQMRRHSSDAAVLLTLLPPLAGVSSSTSPVLAQQMQALTIGLPPTMLVWNGQGSPVISSTI